MGVDRIGEVANAAVEGIEVTVELDLQHRPEVVFRLLREVERLQGHAVEVSFGQALAIAEVNDGVFGSDTGNPHHRADIRCRRHRNRRGTEPLVADRQAVNQNFNVGHVDVAEGDAEDGRYAIASDFSVGICHAPSAHPIAGAGSSCGLMLWVTGSG